MALFFSDDFIHDVSSANDIVDVISSYVVLKKTGRNMAGLCPFHQEKTPSFSVSPEKQFYHCFGCGVGGNVIDFIMRIENLDFVETIKFLAERAHIPIEEQKSTDRGGSKKELIYQMNKEAAHYFHACLLKSDAARHYLLDRGLSQSTVKHFGFFESEELYRAADVRRRTGWQKGNPVLRYLSKPDYISDYRSAG